MNSKFFPLAAFLAGLPVGAFAQGMNYVTAGPRSATNPSGAVTLFAANGGSATFSPHTPRNSVNDSLNNAFSGLNEFTLESVILPNTASFAPAAAGQVAYTTSWRDFVGLGNQSVTGSFRRVLSLAVPSSDVMTARFFKAPSVRFTGKVGVSPQWKVFQKVGPSN